MCVSVSLSLSRSLSLRVCVYLTSATSFFFCGVVVHCSENDIEVDVLAQLSEDDWVCVSVFVSVCVCACACLSARARAHACG